MAPVVHGFEQDYAGRVDFIYLNIADGRNADAMRLHGFRSTPHFFLLRADGASVRSMQGVLPADSLRAALDALLVNGAASAAR